MSKYLSGIDGALYCDGSRVARVRDWSLTGNVEALETTTLADAAKTFMNGVQSYSGQCSVFCYEDNAGVLQSTALVNSVMRVGATPNSLKHRLKLAVNGQAKERAIECDVLITEVGIGASAGDVISANISFVVTGGLVTAGLGVS